MKVQELSSDRPSSHTIGYTEEGITRGLIEFRPYNDYPEAQFTVCTDWLDKQ